MEKRVNGRHASSNLITRSQIDKQQYLTSENYEGTQPSPASNKGGIMPHHKSLNIQNLNEIDQIGRLKVNASQSSLLNVN